MTIAPSPMLSLKELHEALRLRGIEVSYSTLSELINTGDMSSLLQAGGSGQRREFLPDAVEVLVAFWPLYQEAGGRRLSAPALLRRFLDHSASVSSSAKVGTQIVSTPKLIEATRPDEPDVVALEMARGRAQGLAAVDEILTAPQGAALLCVSVRQFRRSVKPSFRIGKAAAGDRWYKSDLFRLGGIK